MTAPRYSLPQLQRRSRTRVIVVVGLAILAIVVVPLVLWWRSTRSSASFADSEVLASNHLGAATLDVEVGDETTAFEAENLAPGDVVSGHLEIVNAGSLPLRYWVTAATDGGLLGDWLTFDVWESSTICDPAVPGPALATDLRLSPSPTILLGSVTAGSGADERTLAPGRSEIVCLGATLPIAAPNAVQGQHLTVDIVVAAEHDVEAEQ